MRGIDYELPASIRDRARQITELHRAGQVRPVPEIGEVTQLMTEMLHIAVHGSTWARAEEPRQVWLGLLREVAALSASTK